VRRGVLLALPLALAGCGGGSVVAPPSGPPASELRVGMIDYRFQLSAATLAPGEVTVVATDAGSSQHDVVLSQGGTVIGRSEVLDPGEEQTFTVRVAAGTPVHLECSLPGHDAAGMHASVRVAAAPAQG
jgi:plastocyanin